MTEPNSYGPSAPQPNGTDGSNPWGQHSYPEPATVQSNPEQTIQSLQQQPYQQQPDQQQSYQQPNGQPYQGPQYQQQPYASGPNQQGLPAYGQPGVPTYAQPVAPTDRKWSVTAILGFVIGLAVLCISLFSGYAVAALLPIALCIRALMEIKQQHKKGKVLAIIGLVLSGLSVIIYLISMIAG